MEHSVLKDRNGDPLLNIRELEEYFMKKALEMVRDSAARTEVFTLECKKANDCLESEFNSTARLIENAKQMKKEAIEVFRTMRTTTTTEVAAMIKPLEELRKFFLGDHHEEEMAKLKEFVEVCERLQKLKQSGFLDAVADTMLKLA